MKLAHLFLVVLLSVAASIGTFVLLRGKAMEGGGHATAAETAYQRVMRTGTLRCSYAVFPPYFTKDAQTGQFGGVWHAITEAIAAHLNLKVDWAEEVGLGDIAASLQAGRTDAFCAGLWTAGLREKSVDFLKPGAFEPLYPVVRADDHRFDADREKLNDPAIRISTIDGEGGVLVADELFPKATRVSLPQLTGYSEMFNQLLTNKADYLIAAMTGTESFMASNPGKLRVLTQFPLKIYPNALAIAYGQSDLRDLLNQAQDDLLDNGELEQIVRASETQKGDFWLPVKRYDQPTLPPR